MDNLLLLAILIMAMWFGVMAFYFYTTKQQKSLRAEIEKLGQMLNVAEAKDKQ